MIGNKDIKRNNLCSELLKMNAMVNSIEWSVDCRVREDVGVFGWISWEKRMQVAFAKV